MPNILVADISGIIRLTVKTMLEDEGLKVYEATEPGQLRNDSFAPDSSIEHMDLILLDLNIARADDFFILKTVVNENPHVPVVILSGESQRKIVIQVLEMGAKDFILKPFDKTSLLSKISDFLDINKETSKNKQDADEENTSEESSFHSALSLELNRSIRSEKPFTCLTIKIGDVSQEKQTVVKDLITGDIRDIDRVFLISSNELRLILPLTSRKGTEVLLERLADKLKKDHIDTSFFDIHIVTFPDNVKEEIVPTKQDYYKRKITEKLTENMEGMQTRE